MQTPARWTMVAVLPILFLMFPCHRAISVGDSGISLYNEHAANELHPYVRRHAKAQKSFSNPPF